MKVKAGVIEYLKPGTEVEIKVNAIPQTFMKMQDCPNRQVHGCLISTNDGTWAHWSKIVSANEEVEIISQ